MGTVCTHLQAWEQDLKKGAGVTWKVLYSSNGGGGGEGRHRNNDPKPCRQKHSLCSTAKQGPGRRLDGDGSTELLQGQPSSVISRTHLGRWSCFNQGAKRWNTRAT